MPQLGPVTSTGQALIDEQHHRHLLTLVADPPGGGTRYGADVTLAPDGKTHLSVTDHVAGEWTEEHPSLSVALARLALVQRCCEANWDRSFTEDTTGHATSAAVYLDHGTT